MGKGVPFFAEEQLVRQDKARQPTSGEINELLSSQSGTSSWEDLVDWPSRSSGDAAEPRRVATTKPAPAAPGRKAQMNTTPASTTPPPRAHLDWMPIRHGHCLRINVSGNMDLAMRSEWRRLLREMAKSNVGQFEFNLTQTPSLSLSGLGMLLLFREIRKSQRNDIKLCHCNKEIWEMLQLTGMDKYFLIQARVGAESDDS